MLATANQFQIKDDYQMPTGTVKHFNIDKGYGFIRRDDGRRDIFVHINRVRNDVEELQIGQRVEFEEQPDREGLPQAVDVQFVAVQFGDAVDENISG